MENYIGPYWSNGKWQESVEFGDQPALSGVDAASRLHDSAYAHYTDEAHRTAADEIYSATLKRLKEPHSGLADVPLYGNYVKNRVYDLGSDVMTGLKYGGPAGILGALVYNGIKGIIRSNDLIHNGAKYRAEVEKFYATDPGIPTTMKNEKQIHVVNIPKPNAPLQTVEYEMFKNKTKIAPTPSGAPKQGSPAEATQRVSVQATAPSLYKPLRNKKRIKPTARDLELYLEYNPGERGKVLAWINKRLAKQ